MNQNDYIILRDENGKAYIAHAGLLDNARNAIREAANSISTTAQQVANKAKGVGRGVRKNHKYILKVFENGRTRYFYKQEEVKAYYEAKKRGIKNAAEYAQNAVKDKASDVGDAVKNVANKATGATVNKVAETAKKNADDAHRWAKMTERAHKENLANFKQNPTETNLAKAKQSGQAVTRANQNEKNARKEADKAQDIADQHPVNKAKSAFDQAKKSADNAVTNAKANYDRMKSEFRNKADQAGNAAEYAQNAVKNKASEIANKARETASNAVESAKDVTGVTARNKVKETRQELIDAKAARQRADDRWWTAAKEAMTHPSDKTEARERQADRVWSEKNRKVDEAEDNARNARIAYSKTPLAKAEKQIKGVTDHATDAVRNMIDQARTAVKDKSEDLSAKAKSTVQSARDSVQGMINNARSSTAKAVNEAWDKIPKNSDGTVNPFDKNFQSTYNDWKTKKDKYDSSLAGRAKDAAEKATESVKDMIDRARKAISNEPPKLVLSSPNNPIETEHIETENIITEQRTPEKRITENVIEEQRIPEKRIQEQRIPETIVTAQDMINQAKKAVKGNSASRSQYSEYRDNDKDFAEKNYSKKNHVEDTDFYTFKRDDGKWVILEEDMKWVLPEGVTGNDPGVRNALKQFADHASSAKAIGNEKYNADQWVDAVSDAIDKAAEEQRKKK